MNEMLNYYTGKLERKIRRLERIRAGKESEIRAGITREVLAAECAILEEIVEDLKYLGEKQK